MIFRDKDGNIVQRTNFDGLAEVGTMSVEDYANRIRTTLQERKTAEIQSTETPLPESPKEEPKNEGGETPTHEERTEGNEENNSNENFIAESNSEDKISAEKDEWGKPLIKASDGTVDFGEITEGYGLQAAPIRLSLGENKKNPGTGKDEGYGLLHIEARHGDQIRKAGYKSVEDFVESVAKEYTEIREGVQIGTTQTYLIVKKDGHANTLYIELSRDGKYWNINTAGIFKTSYGKNREEVYNRHTTAKQSAETAGASRETEQGDTQTSPSMNAPTTSDGKGTTKSADSQENNETLTFKDGTEVPMNEKGEPDFSKMTPEQGAELYEENFGADAESTLASERKAAEKALKDANKMKISGSGWSEKVKAKKEKEAAIAAAQAEIDRVDAIQKALTAKKVEGTLTASKPESTDGAEANVAGSVAAEKFQKAPKVVGRKGSRTLADGTKIKGTYMIVPAESLTASHDATNGYKKSEGFPVNAEGRTINDRDYEHDKDAQDVTEQMGAKYDGQAVNQVPTVSDEGIVYDGNGRTMAGQLAAKKGTDTEYVEALKENAEAFGLTAEDVDKIEHPRVIFVPDERLPYNTETFARFNRNEKKSQNNTQEAIANSKKLSPKDVGAIIGEIENSGSLDSFFNNPKAINDLLKTLVEKGIIGQNEVAGLMDGDLMSAKGREFVQNLLLGAVFKEDTLKMMGIEKGLKSKALNAMRQIMDNSKLGEYSLREEIDKAVQLLYEAKRKGYTVDGLLRQPEMFGESASERYPIEVQIMAKALEGKVADFKEIMEAYNRNAEAYSTGEAELFGEKSTKEEFINEILKLESWKKYDTRKEKQADQSAVDDGGIEGSKQKTRGNNEEGAGGIGKEEFDEGNKEIATKITQQLGKDLVATDEKVGQSTLEDAEATDSDVKYHKETDKDTLEELNNGKTIKVYRAMQVIDGKLYPPMAASVDGKLVEANEFGVWIRADENPDLAIPDIDPKTGKQKVDPKTGELKWKFKLDKGGKDATGKKATNVNAAYNPYWHTSRSPLNDQFKSAWIRPNIVVVECEVPVSELSSGYKAERAKDAVGEVDWKSGSVSGEVYKQTGRARKVILSRWCKPVRVLGDAEVAQRAKEFVGDADVTIPENVLTPKQRIEFEKAGFKIGEPEKGVKKSEQIRDALKLGLQVDNTIKETSLETVAPPTSRDNASVVSNDAVAKIQNNLDATKQIYEKAPNRTRGFITDVSKALGLKPHEASQYGTFQTKDGREFTIRISNHNARVSLFDKNSEQEGISIVISGLRNRGLLNDGNAHVTEVFYSKKAIEQADGKPLVDIIDSIKKALETGVYEDKTGLGKKQEVNSVREFRGKNGEVYGFVLNGKIYLDVKKMRPETPLHEYTHLWTEALKSKNPEEWENVKKLFDEVEGLKEEVQKLYPELKGDDLYDEMIATYSGREGTKKLEATTRELAAKDGKTVSESAKSQSFIEKVKTALQKYWEGVADMLHIHFTNAEEVVDKVLADWAKGVKPGEEKAVETGTHEETPQWHDVKIGLFTIHADKDMTERANKIWGDVNKYLDENPKATAEDIQRKFKIGYNLANFVHAHWEEQNKMPLLPKNEKIDPETDPVAAAAEDFKKEHPMTEDEMRRYLTSKNINSNSYNDGEVRYRKGEETGKYAKESRIVPQDVDKEVSSQIEKKFDEEIEKAFPNEKERERAESVIEGFVDDFAYAKTSQIINEINWQKKNEEYERQRGGGTSGRYNYHRMRFKAAMLASEREMEYRRIRANRIKDLFGIEGSGRQISVDRIAKAFEKTKGRDSRGRQTLFRAALDLAKRLGTELYLEEAGDKASHMGVTHTDRKIGFFLDGLTRTATNAEEFNVTIAHELLHQSINGAITLVKKGKAKGFLSDRQIDGVNTILDIYNKVKDDKGRFKENTYIELLF